MRASGSDDTVHLVPPRADEPRAGARVHHARTSWSRSRPRPSACASGSSRPTSARRRIVTPSVAPRDRRALLVAILDRDGDLGDRRRAWVLPHPAQAPEEDRVRQERRTGSGSPAIWSTAVRARSRSSSGPPITTGGSSRCSATTTCTCWRSPSASPRSGRATPCARSSSPAARCRCSTGCAAGRSPSALPPDSWCTPGSCRPGRWRRRCRSRRASKDGCAGADARSSSRRCGARAAGRRRRAPR